MSERVTVGVPVYKGERFLSETLDCIQAQTYPNLRVIMSVDGPDPACEAICRSYLDDSRFELVVQPERLGWVGNINWCLAKVEDGYWYFHQQDDINDARYVEVLLGILRERPSAALAHCDVQAMGSQETVFNPVPTVAADTPFIRQMAILHEHLPARAFRGLTRAAAVKAAGPVPTNGTENYGVDIAWLAGVARWGDLIRHPEVLYWKRYHDSNTESKWWEWPREKKLEAWATHCVDMLVQALGIRCTAAEARVLFLASLERLGSAHTARTFMRDRTFSGDDLDALGRTFMTRLREQETRNIPMLLDADWVHVGRLFDLGFWNPVERQLAIRWLSPDSVEAGKPFNVRGGSSTLRLRATRHLPPGTRVALDGEPLDTIIRGRFATAAVPTRFTARPGTLDVRLVGMSGAPLSPGAPFTVLSRLLPEPA